MPPVHCLSPTVPGTSPSAAGDAFSGRENGWVFHGYMHVHVCEH